MTVEPEYETTDATEPGDVPAAVRVFGPETDVDPALVEHQRHLDDARASAIEAGRRRGGAAGAVMAGAMLAVRDLLEGPPKEDAPVTVEASSDPTDLDRDGIDVQVGDVGVSAPALERRDPVAARRRRGRR